MKPIRDRKKLNLLSVYIEARAFCKHFSYGRNSDLVQNFGLEYKPFI